MRVLTLIQAQRGPQPRGVVRGRPGALTWRSHGDPANPLRAVRARPGFRASLSQEAFPGPARPPGLRRPTKVLSGLSPPLSAEKGGKAPPPLAITGD